MEKEKKHFSIRLLVGLFLSPAGMILMVTGLLGLINHDPFLLSGMGIGVVLSIIGSFLLLSSMDTKSE